MTVKTATVTATGLEAANVVIMADHIARLRLEGKIHRRGFFFTYMPEGGEVIDLTEHRLERIRRMYC